MYNAKYLQPQVSTRGLFAHYKMWDGLMATGKIFDYTSTGKGGTLVDTDTPKTLVPTYPGFNLDGSNDYISIDDHDDFDVTATLSLSIWIKLDVLPAAGYLIAKMEDTNSEISYGLFIAADGSVAFILSTDGTTILTKFSTIGLITTGSWFHIVVTYAQGVGVKFYVNGVFDKLDATTTGAIYTGTGRIILGARWDSGDGNARFFIDSLIDDTMFFNRVLGDTEVKSIYSVTRQRYGV